MEPATRIVFAFTLGLTMTFAFWLLFVFNSSKTEMLYWNVTTVNILLILSSVGWVTSIILSVTSPRR
jgi:hypothetical protein